MVIHGGRDCPVLVRADPSFLACGGCVSGGPLPRWNQIALTDALSDPGGLAAALTVMES